MKWNIITDSSCDLFPEENQTGEIQFSSVPFVISVGDQEFVDDETLDLPRMLQAMAHEKHASHTACPSPAVWLEQFEKAENSIAITISANLSGSMNSALTARDMALEKDPNKKILILDSRSTGPELVLCVEKIREMIEKGATMEEIEAWGNRFFDDTKVLFALCSFNNLVKNGRMSKMKGILAQALGMWGIGCGSLEGTILIEGKTRGEKKAVKMLVQSMQEKGYAGGKACISHCENPVLAETLKKNIQESWPEAEVEILPTRGLCSYYAEHKGLILSF
ncbi:MAG: DegV family protein [Lachnospiraceae bacterium]|nr:DegV family protein [Lachnospiraceae bacterium]